MRLLPKHRAILPACLTLGTLLCVLPTLADAPATPPAVETHWQKLALQHAVPSDILKALPWEHGTNFPTGVTRVYGLTGDNSLFIEATPEGFANLRTLVKALDVEASQVQIKMTLALVTAADMSASGVKFDSFPSPDSPSTVMADATGPEVARFAQTLKARGAVHQAPNITTTNNVTATVDVTGQPIAILPRVESVGFGVTPRINSDVSISLMLHPKATWRVAGKTNPDGTPATGTQDFQTVCTVANGDTLVIANLFPGAVGADGSQLLLFVTPTIGNGNTALVSVQQNRP